MAKRLIAFVFLTASIALAAASGYKVIKEIKVGGEGGWDYPAIDSAARRLYVAHNNVVNVIDPDAGKVVGKIEDTQGVHGIAIAPALNRGFTSNGRANNVTIFDTKTLKVISQVPVGMDPDAILFEPVTGRVFSLNARSSNATAIDAKTGMVVGTVVLNGKPEFAVADGKGKFYVDINDKNEIGEVDAAKLTETKHYSIAPCNDPSGLAMDAKNRRLFSSCGNRMMVVSDPDAGKVLAMPAIGAGTDGAAFDPGTGYAFSSNGTDGTLTIVQQTGGKWEVVENIATARGARTLAVDEKTHNVYLPLAEPAPAANGQRGRGYLPDSFKILVLGK
jgi:YVTN family beta-propeller protein